MSPAGRWEGSVTSFSSGLLQTERRPSDTHQAAECLSYPPFSLQRKDCPLKCNTDPKWESSEQNLGPQVDPDDDILVLPYELSFLLHSWLLSTFPTPGSSRARRTFQRNTDPRRESVPGPNPGPQCSQKLSYPFPPKLLNASTILREAKGLPQHNTVPRWESGPDPIRVLGQVPILTHPCCHTSSFYLFPPWLQTSLQVTTDSWRQHRGAFCRSRNSAQYTENVLPGWQICLDI